MIRKSRVTIALALLALLTQPTFAQRKFAETASVIVIEVPVNVTVKGEPVRGLTVDNFEVLDGRKAQPIVGFEVVDLATTTAAAGTGTAAIQRVTPAGRRHLLMLFDLSFSEPSALLRARTAAKETVLNGLHPLDLVAVATYSVNQGPKLILNFTGDRSQMEVALATLGVPNSERGSGDPLALVLTPTGSNNAGPTATLREGRQATAEAVSSYLEDQYRVQDRTEKAELQNRVTRLTRSLAEFGRMMDGVEGRKYVVLLSEGIDDKLLVGSGGSAGARSGGSGGGIADEDNADSANTTGSAGESIAFGDIANVSTDEMFGSGKTQNDISRMLQAFKQSNCTIQAVDIGGIKAGGSVRGNSSGANSLSMMASETGGQVFRNFNDLSVAMNSLLEKTSVTYVLAVQPDKVESDGSYHRFKVRLKNGPKGAEIQHRPGFYAPLPMAKQSKEERQLRAANELMGPDGGLFETAVYAAPFLTPEGKPYVPVLVEAQGSSLTAGLAGNVMPLEIYAYALDKDGAVHDFFSQTVGIDLKQAGATLASTGLKYYGHLDLDPGDYTVRVLLRNLETGGSSLRVVPLTVPDFAKRTPWLAAPAFPEPLGKWLMVREPPERQGSFFPFVLNAQPFLPSAAPTLSTQGQTQVAVPAFYLGKGPFSADARLVSSDGGGKAVEVTQFERVPTTAAGADTLVLTLKPGGVGAGMYELQVKVTDQGTGQALTSSVRVKVGS